MRGWLWMWTATALWGCRADVEGKWQGTVGADEAMLSLEQRGSAISGEVCFEQRCEEIQDGTLDERSLVLTYGCGGCTLAKATLDLVLGQGLTGEQHVWSCTCSPEDLEEGSCACREEASFARCVGGC